MSGSYYRPLGQIVEDHRRWAKSDKPRIGIGFSFFDEQATNGGAAPGELVMLQARTGVGKTWIALNIINQNRDVPTAFFSIEMEGHMIVQRLAGVTYDEDTRLIERAVHDHGHHAAVDGLPGTFPKLALIDQPGISMKQMGEAIDQARRAMNVPYDVTSPFLVIIDYDELIGGVRSMDTLGQIERVMKDLKVKAREWKAVVIVLHQMKRVDDETKPPSIKDGRYGGEQSCDYIVAAWRPDPNQLTRMGMRMLKTRGGHELPTVELVMNPASGQLRSPTWAQPELSK